MRWNYPRNVTKSIIFFFETRTKHIVLFFFFLLQVNELCTALNIYISITFEPFDSVFHAIYSKFGEHTVWSNRYQPMRMCRQSRKTFIYLQSILAQWKKKTGGNWAMNRSKWKRNVLYATDAGMLMLAMQSLANANTRTCSIDKTNQRIQAHKVPSVCRHTCSLALRYFIFCDCSFHSPNGIKLHPYSGTNSLCRQCLVFFFFVPHLDLMAHTLAEKLTSNDFIFALRSIVAHFFFFFSLRILFAGNW